MDLARLAIIQARLNPSEPALIFGAGVVDFRGLAAAILSATEALTAARVRQGAFVLVDVQNPFHHVALFYALILMGVRSASVASLQSVERSGPRPDLLLTDRSDIDPRGLPTHRIDARWFAADPALAVDYQKLLGLPGFARPNDVVRYVYSSGTTGHPKCVAVTREALERRIYNLGLLVPTEQRATRMLNMMGFSTILGTMMPLLAHGCAGALCIAGRSADAMSLMRLFGVTHLFGAVGQIAALLDTMGPELPPSGLKLVVPAGARISRELLLNIQARLCATIRSTYASTEMGVLTEVSGPMIAADPSSAGYVLPWAEIEIVDDLGQRVPAGQDGVIRARGTEMAHYADDAGEPVSALSPDGWFYPGDIGRLDADGELHITGRIGEVINRGGIVVAPEEIEDVLRRQPGVVDAGVVAITNHRGIDEIWAGIVGPETLDPDALYAACRATLVDRLPDRLVRIASVPRNDNGKIMRFRLREMLVALSPTP